MTQHSLLGRDHVVVPLAADTLVGALAILLEQLERSGAIRDADALRAAFAATEFPAVITIGEHLALPHYRTDAVDRLNVALGIAREPIPAGTGHVRIVTLVLAPTGDTTTYLHAVSALARAFRLPGVLDRLLAATSADDVLAIPELGALQLQPRLAVRDVMHRDVPRASPATTVRHVVELMLHGDARAIPILGDKDEVLGIVSESDVLRGMLMSHTRERSAEPQRALVPPLTARDIMTRSVMCIAETIGLEEAAQLMLSKDVEQFPVVREGAFTGLVTRAAILRTLYGR